MIVLSHLRHRFIEQMHNVRMTDMEVIAPEGTFGRGDSDPSKVVVTLSGDERSLLLAKLALAKRNALPSKLVKATEAGKESQLQVQAKASDLKGLVDIIRAVHLASGCHLPVGLMAASLPEASTDNNAKVQLIAHRPAIGLLFQEPDIKYTGAFIEALTNYVGVHTKRKADLHYPTAQDPLGVSMGINLARPVGIIFLDSYYDGREALEQSTLLVQKLRALLEHEAPAQQQEFRR